ncbi:glycosyltransferase family protein [[Eubacterium] cellulosolvens]
MRVYLTPNGLGLGHVRRTEVIANTLPKSSHHILYSTYLDGYDYLKQKNYPVVEAVSLTYRVKDDGTVDYRATVAYSGFSLGVRKFLRQLVKEIKSIRRFKPDVIFSDSRVSPIIAAKLLGIPVILLINQLKVEIIKKPSSEEITPSSHIFFFMANLFWVFMRRIIEWVWSQSNVILIPDFPPPYTICLRNLEVHPRYLKKIHFIGPILETKSKELQSPNNIKKKYSLSDNPLIYAAISGPKLERRILTTCLEKLFKTFPKNLQFILTMGEPHREIELTTKNVRIYSWVDEKKQYEFIKAADLIISRAGHGIITKSIAYRKKMLLIPIPDHTEQWNNAHIAESLGIARIIPQEKLTLNVLKDAIEYSMKRSPHLFNEIIKVTSNLNPIRETMSYIYKFKSK